MRLAGIIRMAIASYRSVSPHSAARRTSWASVRMPAVAWTLASGDTTRDIAEAEQMLEARRHNIFKLKIGLRSVDADVAHVAAIKKALGDRASVRVDVNQAWSEPEARRGIPALEAAGVDLIEQPLSRDNRGAQARLSGRFAVPIMADEALHGTADAFDIAARGAADVFALKINQAGGLYDAVKMAAIAEAEGIGLTEEILATPLRYADFVLQVPTAPGIGVELDMERVAFFRRDGSSPRVHPARASVGA
jgi:muconate cycloisomerase